MSRHTLTTSQISFLTEHYWEIRPLIMELLKGSTLIPAVCKEIQPSLRVCPYKEGWKIVDQYTECDEGGCPCFPVPNHDPGDEHQPKPHGSN